MFTDIMLKFGVLDIDKNNEISVEEAGAYLMAMAQLDDQKNNITPQEFIRTSLGIATFGLNEIETGEYLREHELGTLDSRDVYSYQQKFKKNLDATKVFIDTGKLPE